MEIDLGKILRVAALVMAVAALVLTIYNSL